MNFVTYRRVSTTKQGERGTSFEIQQQMIGKYLQQHHKDDYKVIGEFTEVETGTRKKKRVEVYKAIDMCKKEGAVLIVAKLDRMGRDVAFLQTVFKSEIQFVATDFLNLSNPALNRMILNVMMSIAEYEAEIIRERVVKGIRHRIAQGKAVGQKNLSIHKGYVEAASARTSNSIINENNRKALDCIQGKRKDGRTFKEIAEYLNKENYRTSKDRQFSSATVQQLYSKKEMFV